MRIQKNSGLGLGKKWNQLICKQLSQTTQLTIYIVNLRHAQNDRYSGMYPAKLDPADCWILSSYLNAGSSVFRKTVNYMPKITEYVSKIVQNLYSTDAALLRIMQATLYLRAVHSVHVTRRLFSSRVHCKRIKLDRFKAANSRPIMLHGTLVLFSVGQCFFNFSGVFYQSILRYSLENINNMPAVIDHFVRNISQSKMTCKLFDTEILFRSLNKHLTSLKRHLSNKHPETMAVDGPSGSKIPKISDFCVPKASASKFRTLSTLDRVTIALCASSHGLPFNIVEDEIFGWGFEAGLYSRQQITDQASKLAANWRTQIAEFLRGKFCTIMLDGWTNNISGVHHFCFMVSASSSVYFWSSVDCKDKSADNILSMIKRTVYELTEKGAIVIGALADNTFSQAHLILDVVARHIMIIQSDKATVKEVFQAFLEFAIIGHYPPFPLKHEVSWKQFLSKDGKCFLKG